MCERVLFFEEGMPDKSIHKALIEARSLRKALREEEASKRSAAPFKFRRT